MTAENVQRVFEPYFRVEGANAFHGTGLGLSICARLAQVLQARLNAKSQLGVGTCMELELRVPVDPSSETDGMPQLLAAPVYVRGGFRCCGFDLCLAEALGPRPCRIVRICPSRKGQSCWKHGHLRSPSPTGVAPECWLNLYRRLWSRHLLQTPGRSVHTVCWRWGVPYRWRRRLGCRGRTVQLQSSRGMSEHLCICACW